MPFTDLRLEGHNLPRGITQTNNFRCGAACAVYILAMASKYSIEKSNLYEGVKAHQAAQGIVEPAHYQDDGLQAQAMDNTHTTGSAEAWGSTPTKIAKYIKAQVPNITVYRANEGLIPSKEKARARSRRTTHFWLAHFRRQLWWYYKTPPGVADVYSPSHAVLRNYIPKRASITTHFVVQTFFGGTTQIMDPEDGSIREIGNYNTYLTELADPSEKTMLDLVFHLA